MVAENDRIGCSPWLTVIQAAAYLQLTPGTIRNLTSQRRIPHAKNGGIVRYHKAELDGWLRGNSCPGRLTVADADFADRDRKRP